MEDQQANHSSGSELIALWVFHERLLAFERLALSKLPEMLKGISEEMELENEATVSSVRNYDAQLTSGLSAMIPHLQSINEAAVGHILNELDSFFSSRIAPLYSAVDEVFDDTRNLYGFLHMPEHEQICKESLLRGSKLCAEASPEFGDFLGKLVNCRNQVASRISFVASEARSS